MQLILLAVALVGLVFFLALLVKHRNEESRKTAFLLFSIGFLAFGFLGTCSTLGATSLQVDSTSPLPSLIWLIAILSILCAIACALWLWRNR